MGLIIICTLMVCGLFLALLHSSKIQTAVVGIFTKEISKELNTHFEIGHVEYKFFNRLIINDIYIQDQQNDTLLYVKNIEANFDLTNIRHGFISFSNVSLDTAFVNAYHLNDSIYNFTFIQDAFTTVEKKDTVDFPTFIFDNISVKAIRARYDDYQMGTLDASFAIPHLSPDSFLFQIRSFRTQVVNPQREKFRVNDINLDLQMNGKKAVIQNFTINLPHSNIDIANLQTNLPKDDWKKIRAALRIREMSVCPHDFAFFVPKLKNKKTQVVLKGKFRACLDSIVATELTLLHDKKQLLLSDIAVYHPTDKERLFVQLDCQDAFVNATILQDIISDFTNKPFQIDKRLQLLGNIHYKGKIHGNLSSVRIHGFIQSALGTITANGTLKPNLAKNSVHYKGRLNSKRLRLAKITGVQDLKYASFSLIIDGTVGKNKPVKGIVDLLVREVQLKDYVCRNIRFIGKVDKNEYNGELKIDDENLVLTLNGNVKLDKGFQISGDLSVQKCNFYNLTLVKKPQDLHTILTTKIDLKGKNLDDLMGKITIQDMVLGNAHEELMMPLLDITINHTEQEHVFSLNSDYIRGIIKGDFSYATLPITFQKMVLKYLPSLFSDSQRKKIAQKKSKNQVEIDFYGDNIGKILRILSLDIQMSGVQKLNGIINENSGTYVWNFYATDFITRQMMAQDIYLISNADEQFELSVSANIQKRQQSEADTIFGYDLRLNLMADIADDSVQLRVGFIDNADEIHNAGVVELATLVSRVKDKPFLDMQFLPSNFIFSDSIYDLQNSHITLSFADKIFNIDNFYMVNKSHYISANGIISPRPQDRLDIEINRINIAPLLPLIGVTEDKISLAGSLSGTIHLQNLFEIPAITADVLLEQTYMNGALFGDAYAQANFDTKTKTIGLQGDIIKNRWNVANINGEFDLVEKKWGIDILADSLTLGFINHWTKGIIENINGTASGKIRLSGENKQIFVEAAIIGNRVSMRIPFTGVDYYIVDSMFMTPTTIEFPNLRLFDEENNFAVMNGILMHEGWKDWVIAFDADFTNLLAINMPKGEQNFMEGRVYATGDFHIAGTEQGINIDANLATAGNSDITLNVAGASVTQDNEFIRFVNMDSLERAQEEALALEFAEVEKEKSSSNLRLNIMMEVNPMTTAQILLNEFTGDRLLGRGSGNIHFTYETENKKMKMLGTYTLHQGHFNFTLGNIIHKDFDIVAGSNVRWLGDVSSPTIDLKANYKLTASLRDLFGSDASMLRTNRTSVPVNCVVNLTRDLANPLVSFDIELPNSDESIQDQVRSVISTDEMLMQQVVYLLLFNRFFTPDYLRSDESTTGLNETYSLLSSTITGQINSWLSKLTDRVAIGFNFRTDGEGTSASQEYETTFQINPINRLLINGNFGYRYNDLSNRPFFGDIEVEYMLTPEGQLRLKGYSHSVDKYSLKQANMVEGLGLTYNYDYNIGDTKKRILNHYLTTEERIEEKAQKRLEREKRKKERKAKRNGQTLKPTTQPTIDTTKQVPITPALDTIRPLVLPIDTFASENKEIAFSYLPKIK